MRLGFEVGKNYRYYQGENKFTYECAFSGSQIAVLRNKTTGTEFTVEHADSGRYREAIEPRREFYNAFKMGDDTEFTGPYKSRIGSDQFTVSSGYFRYGILELIHHSETRIESVFHIVKR